MAPFHNHRHPFSLEHITALLSKLLSPLPVLIAGLVTVKRLNDTNKRLPNFAEVKEAAPWLIRVAALVTAKVFSNGLARLAANHGWRRDRPDWNSEVVVVTGGVSGIGAEVVTMLVNAYPGVRIAVMDLAEPKTTSYNSHVRYYKVNVANFEEVAATANAIRKTFGHPTMVVNNAGIARAKSLLELTPKEFELTLKVNTLGAYHVVREFLPHLIAHNHGHIVTVASSASFFTAPSLVDYSVSKAGMLALHEGIGVECAGRYNAPNVRTTVVCPTKVRTPLGSLAADHPTKILLPLQEPWQVAERVVHALDSGLSCGTVFVPSHLWSSLPLLRVLPAWFGSFMISALGLMSFTTKETRERGLEGGYKILVDKE